MKELIYEVEFLSDIVLPATSNTEGKIRQLDFIAGSNFLGMVAKHYSQFENSFDMFHSGKVKFGDATLLVNGQRTYKMPLSFFHEKNNDLTIYNHHHISDFRKFTQLKQKREGYITDALEVHYIDYHYSQKSAYDSKKRTSKEHAMFGYTAMKKGQKWQFSINVEDISDNDLKLLEKSIIGIQKLGKSKSAQYGLIEITAKDKQPTTVETKASLSGETILYLNSRIALVDENGNPSYDLKYLFENLKDENIVYEKCQIKTSSFTPYNGARKAKDYERVCLNKGSVIILKDITLEGNILHTGAYLSEGFGEILVNPSFLSQDEFQFQAFKTQFINEVKVDIRNDLSKFLQQRENNKQNKLDVLNEVDVFIANHKSLYKKIKASQWGKIRSICTSGDENFKDEIRSYISNGVKKWDSQQIETLLDDSYSLEFIKLISIQMPKQKGTSDDS